MTRSPRPSAAGCPRSSSQSASTRPATTARSSCSTSNTSASSCTGNFGTTITRPPPGHRRAHHLRRGDPRAGHLRADRGAARRHPARACSPRYMRDKAPDAVLRVFAILCYATPVFFAGLLLKLIFSVWLGWLPGRRPGLHRRPSSQLSALAAPDRHLPGSTRSAAATRRACGTCWRTPCCPAIALGPADRRRLPAAGPHQRHRHARARTTSRRRAPAASASSGW